jgi:hypothetical protein
MLMPLGTLRSGRVPGGPVRGGPVRVERVRITGSQARTSGVNRCGADVASLVATSSSVSSCDQGGVKGGGRGEP